MDWAYEMVFAALIGGLVGSRIDYLIQNWDKVSDDLLGNIFSGSGLVFFGGLVGGAIGVILWALRRGVLSWQLADRRPCRWRSATRWAGWAASSPATATTASRPTCPGRWPIPDGTVPTTDEVHPTPVYETLAMGIATLVLWHLRDRFAPGRAVRALPGDRRGWSASWSRSSGATTRWWPGLTLPQLVEPGGDRARRGDHRHAPARAPAGSRPDAGAAARRAAAARQSASATDAPAARAQRGTRR